MNIAIGADHRGLAHKQQIIAHVTALDDTKITWHNRGTDSQERTDYPIYAKAVCEDIVAGNAKRGVLICGSGVGMAVAANRFCGIYAAVVWNEEIARISCAHDNANVLVIPSDFVSAEVAIAMTRAWVQTTFLDGRYQERLAMIDELGCHK